MADVVFNPVAGVPFSGGTRYVDLEGGLSFALVSANISPSAVQSLTNQSALNTTGSMLDNHGVRNNHSLTVVSGAGVSAGAVQLQGSQDNVNWFFFSPAVTVTTNAASTTFPPVTSSLIPVRYLRAIITTAITGGTISAWVASAG